MRKSYTSPENLLRLSAWKPAKFAADSVGWLTVQLGKSYTWKEKCGYYSYCRRDRAGKGSELLSALWCRGLPAFGWGFTPPVTYAGSRGSQLRHPMHLVNAWAIRRTSQSEPQPSLSHRKHCLTGGEIAFKVYAIHPKAKAESFLAKFLITNTEDRINAIFLIPTILSTLWVTLLTDLVSELPPVKTGGFSPRTLNR